MARFAHKNSLGAGWQFDFVDNEGVNTTPGFLGVLHHSNTAKRIWEMPDKPGTVAMTSDIDASLSNPMTTLGDLIVGGVAGAPIRVGVGANGQVLTLTAGVPGWANPSGGGGGGMTNPMTTSGDLIFGGTDGVPTRLGNSANGRVLKLVAGLPTWAVEGGGMTNPLTTLGDIIVSGNAGVPGRLGAGADGTVLTSVAGIPTWVAGGGALSNPMTTLGDMIYGGASGNPERVPVGLEGQILGIAGGVPAYISPTGVSPASAIQVGDLQNDSGFPWDSGNLSWDGGSASQSVDTQMPKHPGNVIKIMAYRFSYNYPGQYEPGYVITTDDSSPDNILVELLVDNTVVASQLAVPSAYVFPSLPEGCDHQPPTYEFPVFTHELRVTEVKAIELRAGGGDATYAFYDDVDYVWRTGIRVEEWDYTYKLSGITITAPDFLSIPSYARSGTYPNYTYTGSGETLPSWVSDPSEDLQVGNWTTLGNPNSWNQASVPFFVGATYKWTVKGAWVNPSGVTHVQSTSWTTVFYVASIYNNIELTCEITLPTGEVHIVHKNINVTPVVPYKPFGVYDLSGWASYLPTHGQSTNYEWDECIGFLENTGTDPYVQTLNNEGNWPNVTFAFLGSGASKPSFTSLNNGIIAISFAQGTEPDGTFQGYAYLNATGHLQFGGNKAFPQPLPNHAGVSFQLAFSDDGHVFGIQVGEPDTKIYGHFNNNVDPVTSASWNLPAGVTLTAIAMDPTQYAVLYAFDTNHRLLRVDVADAAPNAVVTVLANSTSKQSSQFIPHSECSIEHSNLWLGGHAAVVKLAFRDENGTPYVYLWGIDGVLFQVDVSTGEINIIINRFDFTNAVFPCGTDWIYARAQRRDHETDRIGARAKWGNNEIAPTPNKAFVLGFPGPAAGIGLGLGTYDLEPFVDGRFPAMPVEMCPTVMRNGVPNKVFCCKGGDLAPGYTHYEVELGTTQGMAFPCEVSPNTAFQDTYAIRIADTTAFFLNTLRVAGIDGSSPEFRFLQPACPAQYPHPFYSLSIKQFQGATYYGQTDLTYDTQGLVAMVSTQGVDGIPEVVAYTRNANGDITRKTIQLGDGPTFGYRYVYTTDGVLTQILPCDPRSTDWLA